MEEVSVIVYFADDPTRCYQLVQWLGTLEALDQRHPVRIVARDPESATVVAAGTTVPVFTAPTFSELTELYGRLDPKVVLYCNNSMLNFESLINGRMLHVHINHGESDKQSMASNNAKAYDRVFVAGEAAVQRYAAGTLEFDTSRLVRIGRPQLDLLPASLLPCSPRRTVIYAPTWEGDAAYNNYTSVDTMGAGIVDAILAVPAVRLIYKPHPKVATTRTPTVRDAHRQILSRLARAAVEDPDGGHQVVVDADVLGVMPSGDAMVTDVSAVGLDWLYLRTEKPIFLTDRRHDPERLRQEVPISRCADVIDGSHAGDLTALITARLEHDEHHLARVAMRHHYFDELNVGESTIRFLEAVTELIAHRDKLLGTAPRLGEPGAAITA
jgi:hypothetical protein